MAIQGTVDDTIGGYSIDGVLDAMDAGSVLVVAPANAGKSRLLAEVADQESRRARRIWWCRGHRHGPVAPPPAAPVPQMPAGGAPTEPVPLAPAGGGGGGDNRRRMGLVLGGAVIAVLAVVAVALALSGGGGGNAGASTTTQPDTSPTVGNTSTTVAGLGNPCAGVTDRCITIDDIVANADGSFTVEWTANNFPNPPNHTRPPLTEDDYHAHFFWSRYRPAQAGGGGEPGGNWELTDEQPYTTTAGFLATREGNPQLCVTVANKDHAVDNPDHFHCVDVPEA